MMRSRHSIVAAVGGTKEKKVVHKYKYKHQNTPPLDGRDDIETAASSINNDTAVRHSSIQQQLGPTSSTKNKANVFYRLLRKCNFWMFLAIASIISMHLYRILQTISDIPTTSQQDDMPVVVEQTVASDTVTSSDEVSPTKQMGVTNFNNLYWSDLDEEARGAASKLGYNKEYWDHDEYPPIFDIPFANLNSNEKEAARHLHLVGNFPLFHTNRVLWTSLNVPAQDAANLLGYNEKLWNQHRPAPKLMNRTTSDQRLEALPTNLLTAIEFLGLDFYRSPIDLFVSKVYDKYTNGPSYYNASMGFVVVDVRQDGVGGLVKPQVERLLELTKNLHVELWVSIAAAKTEDKLFQELNSTGRFHVQMMKESHTYGNSTIDLQGEIGGHVGKAYALKESSFDFPLLLDGDSWPCNDYFVKEVEEMIVNGRTDVVWSLAPGKFGGSHFEGHHFVDHRIADEIDVYKTFSERNTGTLVAVKRRSSTVQSWLALTMDIFVQQGNAGINNKKYDQPAFREAFFIHRHTLKEHFATNACRYTSGCSCDSCTLVHNSKSSFLECVQDYVDGFSSEYLEAYTAKVSQVTRKV